MIEVMTIGYEGLRPEDFLNILRRCGVERIVDVRELAISRRKGYAKFALSAMLTEAQIAYTHMPGLGCPRDIRHAYREDGDWDEYTERFGAYLKTKDSEMLDLLARVREEKCCLLCYETDFNFCHRTFVAERLGKFVDRMLIKHLTGPIQGRAVAIPILAAA